MKLTVNRISLIIIVDMIVDVITVLKLDLIEGRLAIRSIRSGLCVGGLT